MSVGLGKLVELGRQVELVIGQVEPARMGGDVGLDIRDSLHLRQIASNRSGAAASDHARQLEDDQPGASRRRTFVGHWSLEGRGLHAARHRECGRSGQEVRVIHGASSSYRDEKGPSFGAHSIDRPASNSLWRCRLRFCITRMQALKFVMLKDNLRLMTVRFRSTLFIAEVNGKRVRMFVRAKE
jgi:hypothetical protein